VADYVAAIVQLPEGDDAMPAQLAQGRKDSVLAGDCTLFSV
jgi:hypothetical protein